VFKRIRLLAGEIVEALVYEQGQEGVLAAHLRSLLVPVLLMRARIRLALIGNNYRYHWRAEDGSVSREAWDCCGRGQGKTSSRATSDIQMLSDAFSLSPEKVNELVRASRMSAKVDNGMVQDGYQLYHHAFFFTENGDWAVVQQGMNETTLATITGSRME
jgi:uncharacterized protein